MTAAEADTFKMLSMMEEEAEATMPTEMREGALKMVAEVPKKLETVVGELNLMELESGATMMVKALA